MKRYFNTSGPNNPKEHYTLMRPVLIQKGIDMVSCSRYFTIWAPRQTGKSTYFRLLSEELKKQNYLVAHINVENFLKVTEKELVVHLTKELEEQAKLMAEATDFINFYTRLKAVKEGKCVLIIDEIEGLNPQIFGQFLHTIRNLYHSRENHCLKSVILVGVANITGIVSDNASPFNIADNLDMDYFTKDEVYELLHQHESETQQLFDETVKEKIAEITAGQPGLVNGFARKLTDNTSGRTITTENCLAVENWYLHETIDKNISNIINKAKTHRNFVEKLLFTEAQEPFRINKPAIKELFSNGVIRKGETGNVEFWVPLYKKCLYDAFYPYTNGEKEEMAQSLTVRDFFDEHGNINMKKLITGYKEYVKRRSFKHFMEKDEQGNYISIKESALLYSFETYIQAFVQEVKGKCYREVDTGLGKSDLLINIQSNEFLTEAKKYYSFTRFTDGKKQLAYYCNTLGLTKSVYLVFIKNTISLPPEVQEQTETIEGVEIQTFIILYDEEKDF